MLIAAGIGDPLLALPDMHALLDFAEHMLTQNMDAKDRNTFNLQLYRPDVTTARREKIIPAGFSAEDQMSAFDAFTSALSTVENNHR